MVEVKPPEPAKNWNFVKITVSDVDVAANNLAEAKARSKKLKNELDEAKRLEEEVQAKFIDCLKMVDKTDWSTGGRKFETATRKFYSMPKDFDVKEKLFDWIEKTYDKDTRKAYVTINAMAFNSLLNNHEGDLPDYIGKPFEKVTVRIKTK